MMDNQLFRATWLYQLAVPPLLVTTLIIGKPSMAQSPDISENTKDSQESISEETYAVESLPNDTISTVAPAKQHPSVAPAEPLYFINEKGKTIGPFDRRGVVDGINAGTISSSALINVVGNDSWVPIQQLFPLSKHASAGPTTARQSGPPSNGLGLRVTGAIFLTVGIIELAGIGLCLTGVYDDTLGREVCMGMQVGAGAAFTLSAIPLLIIGNRERRRYVEWLNRQQSRFTGGFSIAPDGSNVTVAFGYIF